MYIVFYTSVYIYSNPNFREMYINCFVLILCVICNEIATNYGASRHVPGELLKDIAFEYIEELPADNVLVKLGDTFTVVPVYLIFVFALQLDLEDVYVLANSVLRWFSMFFLIRSGCIAVTSLPGPAKHCRLGSGYSFPGSIYDILGTVPIGHKMSFKTCGDLIPSGHIGCVILSLFAFLRCLDKKLYKYRYIIYSLCWAYVIFVLYIVIADRRHYTIDLIIGILLAVGVAIIFRDSWIPSISPYEPLFKQREEKEEKEKSE